MKKSQLVVSFIRKGLLENLPKCLSLSSHEFLDDESRFFRIARTTTNNAPIPSVSRVPVSKAANGINDKPPTPSVSREIDRGLLLGVFFLQGSFSLHLGFIIQKGCTKKYIL